MTSIRPYPFHDITSGSMKPPVMPYVNTNNKPTRLGHTLYGKVMDGMADIHRPVKQKVAHMGSTLLTSYNDKPLQFPLSNQVTHLKRANYAEVDAILAKSAKERASMKNQPDYHLQMKALEAKRYINMGMNADNEKENALRDRLSASGASPEEIEKILKDARIEKFKKDIKTPLSMEQKQQRTMASHAGEIKSSVKDPFDILYAEAKQQLSSRAGEIKESVKPPSDTKPTNFATPLPTSVLENVPKGKQRALIARMNGYAEGMKRDNTKAEGFAPGPAPDADFIMVPRRRRR